MYLLGLQIANVVLEREERLVVAVLLLDHVASLVVLVDENGERVLELVATLRVPLVELGELVVAARQLAAQRGDLLGQLTLDVHVLVALPRQLDAVRHRVRRRAYLQPFRLLLQLTDHHQRLLPHLCRIVSFLHVSVVKIIKIR